MDLPSPEVKAIEDLRRGQNELFEKMRLIAEQTKEKQTEPLLSQPSLEDSFPPSLHKEQSSESAAILPKKPLEPVKQFSYNVVHNGSVVVPPSRRNNSVDTRSAMEKYFYGSRVTDQQQNNAADSTASLLLRQNDNLIKSLVNESSKPVQVENQTVNDLHQDQINSHRKSRSRR